MSERRRERTRVPDEARGGARRRRPRGGGGNGGGGGPASDQAGKAGGKQGGKRNRKGRKRSPNNRRNKNRRPDVLHDAARFWGDPSMLPEARQDVRITDDPSAVPRSLGAPPLPGHEAIAEQYFTLFYDRAVTTAGLLAAAGGLIDAEDLVDGEG